MSNRILLSKNKKNQVEGKVAINARELSFYKCKARYKYSTSHILVLVNSTFLNNLVPFFRRQKNFILIITTFSFLAVNTMVNIFCLFRNHLVWPDCDCDIAWRSDWRRRDQWGGRWSVRCPLCTQGVGSPHCVSQIQGHPHSWLVNYYTALVTS